MLKNKILMIILIIIIIVLLFIEYFNFGITKYQTAENIKLEIPKLSIKNKEDSNYISFLSFRNKKILKKELDNIVLNYEKITCDNKIYYYNKKDDVTIISYDVKNDFIINKLYIKYQKGFYNNCIN